MSSEPESLRAIAGRVDDRLARFVADERNRWVGVDRALAGPRRGRPCCCSRAASGCDPRTAIWGYVGAGGDPASDRPVDAGAAFELLHAFALVHDDVMDGSANGVAVSARPIWCSLDEALVGRLDRRGSLASAKGVAILVGDLAFVYADMLRG